MAQDKDEDLSRIAYEAQSYQQQGQFMQQQIASIQDNISEIGAAIGTLRNLDRVKDNEVLLPLGAGAHAHARLTDTEKVLVNIGSEVIAEKPVSEALEILSERLKRLESTRDKLQGALLEISKKLEQLDTEAKKIMSKKGAR